MEGRLGQFADLRGGLGEKEGGWYPNAHYGYDIDRNRSRHGYEYAKYKICLMMMVVCNKEHLNNIWSRIHGNVKQHWSWVWKKRCLYKTSVYSKCISSIPVIWV